MNQPTDSSSPIPKAQREIVCKYSRLDTGFPVASLDPAPIEARTREIDSIWREALPNFKMYLNDIVITFDRTNLQFHKNTPHPSLNAVRDAILKRLVFDGIKSGHISMPQNHQHVSLELTTPGFQKASLTLQREIFALIAIKLPPNHAAAQGTST